MSAPEPFNSPLTLSPSKGEPLAQDRPVEGCVLCGFRLLSGKSYPRPPAATPNHSFSDTSATGLKYSDRALDSS